MKLSSIILFVLGSLWILAIAFGLTAIMQYQFAPGQAATPPERWPPQSAIRLSNDKPTLVMLAHPQCPCTQASLSELSRLISAQQGKVNASVLFLKPKSLPQDWAEKTSLHSYAAQIPGVAVIDDVDGMEAKRFHGFTSGQTFIYDRNGKLLYSGGITSARGQIGESAGFRSLVTTLETPPSQARSALVFGCPLAGPIDK